MSTDTERVSTPASSLTSINLVEVNGTPQTPQDWTPLFQKIGRFLSHTTDSVQAFQGGAWTVAITGTVGVTQSTSPWVISGTVSVSGTVAVTQSTSPWVVSVSNTVTVTGTVAVTQSTSPWVVSGTVTANQGGTWTVQQGSPPWAINLTQYLGVAASPTNPVDVQIDFGGVKIDPRQIRTLTTSDQVTVFQGTSPWVISGTVSVSGTVAVTQSTSPWVVSGTVAATQSGTWTVQQGSPPWSVTVSGTVAVTQSTSPWVVSGTVSISGTVAVTQSTSPWVVSGTVAVTQSTSPWVVSGTVSISGTVAVTQSTSPWVVSVSGTVAVTQSTSPWVVSGSVSITGTVAVTQSTSPWIVSLINSVTGNQVNIDAQGNLFIRGNQLDDISEILLQTQEILTDTTDLSQVVTNLNIKLTALATLIRWNTNTEPTWTEGTIATAPAAGATLVSKTVSEGKTGTVLGIHISLSDAAGNVFTLQVGGVAVKQFPISGIGEIFIVLGTGVINAQPSGSVITINNTTAGAAATLYQASLLYEEQ